MDIVLADDHALIRDGIAPFLAKVEAGARVLEAASLDEALAAARAASALGLVILDLNMPGMNGTEGLARFRQEFPAIPTLILSGSVRREDAMATMEAGAAGYIPKTMRGDTIIDVLRLVLAGEKYLPPFMFERPAPEDAPPAEGHPGLAHLTPRERDILGLIVEGAPNKVIARTLSLQEVTVKAHLRNMFRKMGVGNRTEAARMAMLAGITGRKPGE